MMSTGFQMAARPSTAMPPDGTAAGSPLRAATPAVMEDRNKALFYRSAPSKNWKAIALLTSVLAFLGVLGMGAGHAEMERAAKTMIPGRSVGSAHTTMESGVPGQWAPAAPQPGEVRLANARIPFATGGLTSAAPFFLGTLEANRQRAIDCLAAAAYYEAGDGVVDQRAVMQVVLNRLRHPAFPHTICGVIFQGSELSTGCQFTFTCDHSIDRRRPSPRSWQAAQTLAGEMLAGRVEPAVGLATHYHTDWVLPNWSRQMDKIAAVHTHLFFRWRDARGSSSAFRSGYDMMEPRISLLAGLSAAHHAVGAAVAAFPLPPETAQGPDYQSTSLALERPAIATPERLSDQGQLPDADTFLVTLDAAADGDSFLKLAQKTCSGHSHCRLIGWTDPARKPDQFPIPGIAVDAISFTFIRQGPLQSDQAQWNCAEFPRRIQNQCLRRGT